MAAEAGSCIIDILSIIYIYHQSWNVIIDYIQEVLDRVGVNLVLRCYDT